jgi:hypothetical protein
MCPYIEAANPNPNPYPNTKKKKKRRKIAKMKQPDD